MTAFVIESWIWYGVAISMVLLRLVARYLHFNAVSRFQIEDWFMVFIACLYTILIASLNVCTQTNTNLIDPHDIPYLTPEDISERIFGSKMILVVEQCMCAVQWGTKACLLMLYWRLTENLVQSRLVKGAAIYVGTTYGIMEILYFGVWCRPFHEYWATPTDNVQCNTALHHLIVNLVFNLTSDLLIMSIPLPLLMRSRLEMRRKLLLIFPFSLGFFSIICAILSKNLSFTQPFSGYWVYWYTREASTVMIVSNMPYTWGLLRRIFKLSSFHGQTQSRTGTNNLTIIRTRDTANGMVAGEIQELQGISISSSESNDLTSKRKRSIFPSELWHHSKSRGLERLPSSPTDQDTAIEQVRQNHKWSIANIDKKEISVDVDPTSSSSSAASVRPGAKRQDQPEVDAINKLYRLDDDDLMLDIEKEEKRLNMKKLAEES